MKDKKKILFVSQNFYPENFGINDIVSDMVARGFKVDVLTGLPNYPVGKFFDGYGIFKRGEKYYKGARLYRCAVFPRLKNSKIGISLNYATFPIFASIKLFLLMFNNYDKVFVYEPSPLFQAIPGIIISKIKKCEKIIYVLDIWPESVYSVVDFKNKKARKVLKKYSDRTYKKFDKLLVTSRGFIPQLEDIGIGKDKIIYLPQWSLPIENETENDFKLNKIKDTFNVVFTGNVGIPQNLGVLIEAACLLKNYKDIRFIIVGDGDYYDEFVSLVKEKSLEEMFVFEGRRPFEEMQSYYNAADCLFASLKSIPLFEKIIPAKIQAYMQSGKPILCAINGESSEIINEAGCGFCSEAGNAYELSENIIKLYNMSVEERIALGENGIFYSNENFNREKLLNKLELILSE